MLVEDRLPFAAWMSMFSNSVLRGCTEGEMNHYKHLFAGVCLWQPGENVPFRCVPVVTVNYELSLFICNSWQGITVNDVFSLHCHAFYRVFSLVDASFTFAGFDEWLEIILSSICLSIFKSCLSSVSLEPFSGCTERGNALGEMPVHHTLTFIHYG